MTDLFCGIDLGGTTLNIGLVDSNGRIVAEEKHPSRVKQGVNIVVTEIASILNRLKAEQESRIVRVGIGVAGLVDARHGVLKEATNFPGWLNVPLVQLVRDLLALPVFIDNDANVAALGEHLFGAGRGSDHMMMVTLGTGVGAGLILDGQIYRGAFGAAGEFGHITIKKDGWRCLCGRPGCVEAYVGTRGIIKQVDELRGSYADSALNSLTSEELTPRTIYERATEGDALARVVFERVGENLGFGLSIVVNLLNVDRIVVGGGVALAGDLLIGSAQKTLDELALNNSEQRVEIAKAELGEHAGIVGAASLAMASH